MDMEEAGDIVRISIPFAAGAAVAAVLAEPGTTAFTSCAGVVAAMLCCVLKQGRSAAAVYALMFMTGALCWSTSMLVGTADGGALARLAGSALDRFSALIDRAGFDRTRTAPVIRALLTGRKETLDREVVDAFRRSGASHILALSGLHMGVIYVILDRSLSVGGNSQGALAARSFLIIATAAFYTMMTGASTSMTRAFLFICINEILRLRRDRKRSPLSVLCLALTIQLALTPQVIGSAGFQMSYLAMAGIFILFPKIDAWYPQSSPLDPFRKIWNSIALSVSCQLFTAPVAWINFHSFPKYFLLTNLLALPLSTAIMASAVTTLVLTALGICPLPLVRLTDMLVSGLDFCLRTISSM